MKTRALLVAAALVAFAGSSAFADSVEHGNLTIKDSWTRATPPNAKSGGAFVSITNNGNEDAHLVAAISDHAKRTEIHEMSVNDGVMKMRKLDDGVVIPAGETLELKPGSYHVMFMGINQPFKMGEELKVTLQFEKAGPVEVTFPIMKIGAKSGKMHH
ncbi:hypothetical protein PsAD2_02367 [Pseudovibrio axinellae]|uniref:Copper chaperone PCu(A)C n=1 Tax=Pseudovibrio axinellae TaxID=989403 RepID=A0A165YHP9_9HYPH|nr:copper chaperone PCu(A)C [Pseudovibrio axinellae]KZL18851.1 hypothetical protein PsAD2_02367 [Pseudovibrio axinellae]SEP90352.1 hypothetical protein SAMN05421798_101674 [Pseudovibrio axinellae]